MSAFVHQRRKVKKQKHQQQQESVSVEKQQRNVNTPVLSTLTISQTCIILKTLAHLNTHCKSCKTTTTKHELVFVFLTESQSSHQLFLLKLNQVT